MNALRPAIWIVTSASCDVSRLSTPMLFSGETYFVTAFTTDVEIDQDFGDGPARLCEIEFDINQK